MANTSGMITAALTERLRTRRSGSFERNHWTMPRRAGTGGCDACGSVMVGGGSSLRRQGPGDVDAEIHPLGQLAFRFEVLAGDPQPARSRAAGHHGNGCFRGSHQLVRALATHADENAPLAARCDGHVPADEESNAAEHLLLAQASLETDQCPDSLRQVLVERHRASVRNRRATCLYSSSVRSSRQRSASLRNLARKPSMRVSLALICSASDSFRTRASWSVDFCSANAFLL